MKHWLTFICLAIATCAIRGVSLNLGGSPCRKVIISFCSSTGGAKWYHQPSFSLSAHVVSRFLQWHRSSLKWQWKMNSPNSGSYTAGASLTVNLLMVVAYGKILLGCGTSIDCEFSSSLPSFYFSPYWALTILSFHVFLNFVTGASSPRQYPLIAFSTPSSPEYTSQFLSKQQNSRQACRNQLFIQGIRIKHLFSIIASIWWIRSDFMPSWMI